MNSPRYTSHPIPYMTTSRKPNKSAKRPKSQQQQSQSRNAPSTQMVPQKQKRSTILRDALSSGGAFLGGLTPLGRENGSSLGRSISKWLGAGDYSVSSNNLTTNPKVLNMHTNRLTARIVHKEYIGDITSSATANTFKSQGYALNPGVSATFPWLSIVAQQYQEYEFKGLVFEFVSATSTAIASGTNTTIGTVMMGTNYRSTANIYTDKISLLASYFSNDTKTSEDFCHPIECDPKENPFAVQYVRGAVVPAGEDQKMYDLGLTTFASTGVQGTNVNLGELWVTYDVELRKPIDTGSAATFASYAHYNSQSISFVGNTPFIGLTPKFDSIGVTFDNNHIYLPPGLIGNYLISLCVNYGAVSTSNVTALTTGTLVNCTQARSFADNAILNFTTSGPIGTNNQNLTFFVFISNPTLSSSIGITGSAVAIASSVIDVIITQVSGAAVPSNTL